MDSESKKLLRDRILLIGNTHIGNSADSVGMLGDSADQGEEELV